MSESVEISEPLVRGVCREGSETQMTAALINREPPGLGRPKGNFSFQKLGSKRMGQRCTPSLPPSHGPSKVLFVLPNMNLVTLIWASLTLVIAARAEVWSGIPVTVFPPSSGNAGQIKSRFDAKSLNGVFSSEYCP